MTIASQTELNALLLATATGDRAAFRLLYAATSPRFFGATRRILRRPELAEEALQEAYLRIWRGAKSFDPERGNALFWMSTIVRRAALDRIPAARHEEELAEDLPGSDGRELEEAVPSARLERCLSSLVETHRKAILYAYIYGMSHTEIAAKLDTPLGTVKSWVRRGLLALKECLGA